MKKDWSSLQISFLFYLLVVLFPVNLYFTNALLEDTQDDSVTIKNISFVGNGIRQLTLYAPKMIDKRLISRTNQLLIDIDKQFIQNEANQIANSFYDPKQEFVSLLASWKRFKVQLNEQKEHSKIIKSGEACWKTADKLMIVVEKIADLKRERGLDALYLGLLFTMIVMVAMIFFIRNYMKMQLVKHTIYDLATKLFNRDYFLAEIKKSSALADRHDHDLSVLFVAIDNFDQLKKEEGPETIERIFKLFGALMITLTRESDIASRYSEDEFTVITPQTSLDNAVVVAERIRSKVLAYDFAIGHPLSVSISIAKHHLSENNELLLKRGERILLEAKKTGNKILKADSKNNESKNRIT